MSYNPNSLEARKGGWGEAVVRRLFERCGAVVSRPDGRNFNEASLIDFHIKPLPKSLLEEQLVEVKVRKAMDFAYGQFPCYTILVAQIERYKEYARNRQLPLTLWIVDPTAGKIFANDVSEDGLEHPIKIDGKQFPFDQQTECGEMRFYHRQQFIIYDIPDDDIEAFRNLEAEQANLQPYHEDTATPQKKDDANKELSLFPQLKHLDSPPEQRDDDNTKVGSRRVLSLRFARSVAPPSGTCIAIYEDATTKAQFVMLRHLSKALGFKQQFAGLNSESRDCVCECFVPITTGVSCEATARTLLCACVPFESVYDLLIKTLPYTYGARQGTTKYKRNIATQQLAAWWKNVVLQEEEPF